MYTGQGGPRLAAPEDKQKVPILVARRHADAAKVMADEIASNLLIELKDIQVRCSEMRLLDMLPAGERDAFIKLGAEMNGRIGTILAIRGRR